MSYKILTKNGIDNTNIDGARDQHFNAGMRDGIVKGALNEGIFSTSSTNSVFLDACELRISGHRVVIDEPVYKTFENAPTTNTRYAYVAEIKVDDNSNVEFGLFVQSANIPLVKDNLFKTTKGKGTYQLEIGRFTLQTDGTITDLVRTADVITGGGATKGAVQIGNVTTEKIDINLPAEVDIDQRYDEQAQKEYLDFKFHLPIDLGDIDERTQASYDNSAEAKRLAQEANDNSQTALNTANDAKTESSQAKETSEQADLTADSALTVASAAADTANAAEETANSIDAKATEALTNSQTAVNTANEAKTIAESAAEKSGTKVTVGGIFQSEFDADIKANQADLATVKVTADGALQQSGGEIRGEIVFTSGNPVHSADMSYYLGEIKQDNKWKMAAASKAEVISALGITALQTMLGATQQDLMTKDSQNIKLTGNQEIPETKNLTLSGASQIILNGSGGIKCVAPTATGLPHVQYRPVGVTLTYDDSGTTRSMNIAINKNNGGYIQPPANQGFTFLTKGEIYSNDINGKKIAFSISEMGDGYIRYHNGIQICWGTVTLPNYATYPKPFKSPPGLGLVGIDIGWEAVGIVKNKYSSEGFQGESRYNNQQLYYIAAGKWR